MGVRVPIPVAGAVIAGLGEVGGSKGPQWNRTFQGRNCDVAKPTSSLHHSVIAEALAGYESAGCLDSQEGTQAITVQFAHF